MLSYEEKHMKNSKAYLIGSLVTLLAGASVWRLFFPQVSGLNGVCLFLLCPFALWSAAAVLLGLLGEDIPKNYRLVYAAIFVGYSLNQVALVRGSDLCSLFNMLLTLTLFFVQRLQQRQDND